MSRVSREIAEALILALIVYLVIWGSVRNFRVDGSSMFPTLENQQILLVNKLVYSKFDTARLSRIIPFWNEETSSDHFAIHGPKRGEVIVFRFPGKGPPKDFVKRVIGLPGEKVRLAQGVVYINDVELEEPYLTSRDNSTTPELRLLEGEYYVMGDNRRSSNDSRNWGPVPEANLIGKVWVVYWPFSELQLLDTASSWVGKVFR